jgi:hypothetical protein
VKHKDLRPWLSVIASDESLVSHAGGALLVETARRGGLAKALSRLLGPWRRPLAVHDPGKIVLDFAISVNEIIRHRRRSQYERYEKIEVRRPHAQRLVEVVTSRRGLHS